MGAGALAAGAVGFAAGGGAFAATCDGATALVTGVEGGTFSFADAPTDGAIIDSATGTITGGSYGFTYNIEYTTNDACPSTSVTEVTTGAEEKCETCESC